MSYNPWDSGSVLYRRLLMTGMALLGVGILLTIVGAFTQALPVSWTGLAVIGVGLLVHLIAQWTRFRQARRERTDRLGT